jgi:hypothetical protein
MKHGLARPGSSVDDRAIPILCMTLIVGDARTNPQQMSKQGFVSM